MALNIKKIDTWVASVEDKPGGLSEKLGTLAKAGVNLEFMIARRTLENPGGGVVFVTPIKGAAGIRAAHQAGFIKTSTLQTIRIEGKDRKGQCADIAGVLGENGLNLRGLSGVTFHKKFLVHVAFDNAEDVAKAIRILKKL